MVKRSNSSVALILMIVISFASQILTVVKTSMVAGIFGVSDVMDAYSLANSIVSFVFGFVAAGISTIVIPEYANNKDRKNVNTFITYLYGGMLLIIIAMMFLRYQIVGMFNNRNEVYLNLTTDILTVLLFAQYLSSFSSATVAYFQCEGRYNLPKIINLLSQLIVIVFISFLDNLTIMDYTIIVSAGLAFNFVFDLLLAFKSGWRYRPIFRITPEVKLLFRRLLPILFSTGIYRVSLMVDSGIAALLETGKITLLSYASQISAIVNTVFVGNFLIYIYPKLAKSVKSEKEKDPFWEQTGVFHGLVCVIVAGFFTVGRETVELLFCRGLFSLENGYIVFVASAIYVFGQQFSVIRDLLYRFYYAKGNTKIPAINSVWVSVFNIVVSLILVWLIGFYGIVLGTVVASVLSLCLIFCKFKKSFGFSENILKIIGRYLRNILIMAVTIGVVLLTKSFVNIDNRLLAVLVFGCETLAINLILVLLFNRKMLSALLKL